MPVVAILAPQVEGTEGEICILSGITELPEAILAYIQRVWNYQKRFTVNGSRGGSPSVFLVEFHPSMQNSILGCKNGQPLS